jgi:hypothetical protein
LTIAPGATASAIVTATSPTGASVRSYYVWLSAADAQLPVHNATAYATYAVVSGCARNTPALSASPSAQSATSGTAVTYDLTLSNRDSQACAPTTFTFQPFLPTGWSVELSAANLTLAAGAAQTVRTSITSMAGSIADTYALQIRAADATAAEHSTAAAVAYTVTAESLSELAAPSSLSAMLKQKQKQVQLTWNGAGAGAGFRILRNGSVVGVSAESSWTDVAWRSGDTYSYVVVAFDFSGHVSPPSNTATVTIPGGGSKRK